jgi:hypothetical protein
LVILELGLPVGETLEQLWCGHVIFSLQLSDRAGDGVGELAEPVAFAV